MLLKKSSTIPGKIFRDVDVRPLEQSCLAQHVLSVLQGEQTLTNVDKTSLKEKIKDKRKHEMRKRRIEQQRISNLEVVESDKNRPTTADLRSGCQTRRLKKRCKLKKNNLPNISINSFTFFRGIWRVMPRLYLKRSCTYTTKYLANWEF